MQHRACEASLLAPRGPLDESRLAWLIHLQETTRTNAFLDVQVGAGAWQSRLV